MGFEDLTTCPLDALARVVRLFEPFTPPDIDRLQECTENISSLELQEGVAVFVPRRGIRGQRDLSEFRWFDTRVFARIERSLADVLRARSSPWR